MTPRVWIERPIPSVEALSMDEFPPGTIAIHPDHDPVERCPCSRWESGDGDRYDSEMAGWVALVPVEAEEETGKVWRPGDQPEAPEEFTIGPGEPMPDWLDALPLPLRRRLVTPWEDA